MQLFCSTYRTQRITPNDQKSATLPHAGFLPTIFVRERGKICCYANSYCYAHFSIVLRPILGEVQMALRGRMSRGRGGKLLVEAIPCPPVEENQTCSAPQA